MNRFLSLLMVIGIAGCQKAKVEGPPELKLGRDECVHCGMIVNDARYAAAALIELDGRVKAVVFDDIGDLVDYAAGNPAVHIRDRYVCDYKTKKWLAAEKAVIVHVPDLHTPMGSGLIAFSNADAASGQAGRRMAFSDLPVFRAQTMRGTH